MWTFDTYRVLFCIATILWVGVALVGVFWLERKPCRIGVVFCAAVGILGVILGGLAVVPMAWVQLFNGSPGYKPEHWQLGALFLVFALLGVLLFWALDKPKHDAATKL